jgi:hypothetical protein
MGHLYGDPYKELWVRGPDIGNNTAYQQFVWDKVLGDDLIAKYLATVAADDPCHVASGPGSHLSINCVLYDHRVIDKIYPYNLPEEWFPDGEKKFDESIVNRLVREGELKNIIVRRSIVHHYAFNRAQVDIMQSHPIDRVYDYLMRLGTPQSKAIAAG